MNHTFFYKDYQDLLNNTKLFYFKLSSIPQKLIMQCTKVHEKYILTLNFSLTSI